MKTISKMMETLPDKSQNQVVEHLRYYIADFQDELKWDSLFEKTQKQLIKFARQAKGEIKKGYSKPMDLNQL